MVATVELQAINWWRFSRYAIRSGYVVPADGAELSWYDPWEEYRRRRSGRRHREAPWEALLGLLKPGSARERDERLVRWCQEFGPLGTLLHRSSSAVLAPRWRKSRATSNRPLLEATLPRLRRTSTGWIRTHEARLLDVRPATRALKEGDLVGADDRPKRWPDPSAVLEDFEGRGSEVKPLGESWSPFFPGVPAAEAEAFVYPTPLTEEFARQYAEPASEFWKAVRTFDQALRGLRHHTATEQLSSDEAESVREGHRVLNALVSSVHPAILPVEGGSFDQVWVAPSLLASLAMMAVLDLTTHGAVRSCVVCGGLFTSSAYQVRFCSARCRKTSQMRSYREREREKGKKR